MSLIPWCVQVWWAADHVVDRYDLNGWHFRFMDLEGHSRWVRIPWDSDRLWLLDVECSHTSPGHYNWVIGSDEELYYIAPACIPKVAELAHRACRVADILKHTRANPYGVHP